MDIVVKRCKEQLSIKLNVQESMVDFILEKGYDDKYGARPIRRAVQTYLEDKLAEELILKNIKAGDTVTVSAKNGKPVLRVRTAKQ